MREFRMKKTGNKWDYLSDQDSKLYEAVRESKDPKDVIIKRLLEDKAGASWTSHVNSRY